MSDELNRVTPEVVDNCLRAIEAFIEFNGQYEDAKKREDDTYDCSCEQTKLDEDLNTLEALRMLSSDAIDALKVSLTIITEQKEN